MIHVIHGVAHPDRIAQAREEMQKTAHLREVYKAEYSLGSKRLRIKASPKGPVISFSEEDMQGLVQSHSNALIIKLDMDGFGVERILVDEGSATEIIYYKLYQSLGLKDQDLKKVDLPLLGFNSNPVWPVGEVTLPVRAGSVLLEVCFLVVDVPSPYNAIMGRPWLHQLRAVSSTLHQVLKFPNKEGGIETIRGDQVSA